MKITVLFVEGAKQIIMTPETKHEKEALQHIAPGDRLSPVLKTTTYFGTFADKFEHVHYSIGKCLAGWYRPFPDNDSLMFVIEPQPEETKDSL